MAQKFLTDIRLPNSGQLYLWHDHDSNYLKYDRWRASASAGMNIQNASGSIFLRSNNALTLTLDDSQNATFAGNIGIKESSIDANLHITDTNPNIKFERSGQGKWAFGMPNSQTYLAFDETSDDLSTPTMVLTKTTKRVGIGTTAPDQKFHVEFDNTDTSFSGGSGGAWGSEGIRIENISSTANTMAMLHLRNNDADIHIAGIRKGTDDSDLGFYFEGTQKVLFENDGSATFAGTLTVEGADAITIPDYILHAGDDSKFGFPSNDNFKIRLAGSDLFTMNTTTATFAGDVTLNTGTAKKLSILASTHDTNTAQTATLELGYTHSGGAAAGNIVLTEAATNAFDADMTFGLPHNNGSGGSTTRTALTLDGGTLSATFAGDITISNAAPAINLTDTDNSSNIALSSVGGALIVNSPSDQVYQYGGTEKFRISTSTHTSAAHVVPGADSTYNLGSNSVRWANVYADTLHGDGSNLTNLPATQSPIYAMPDVGGTAGWRKLGTLSSFSQGGNVAIIEIEGHQGYNASNGQDYSIKLYVKTSNGNGGGPNGQGFNSWYERTGSNSALAELVWDNSASNTYDLYMFTPNHSVGGYYTVTNRVGTWTHSGASASDPGANSGTVLEAANIFTIDSSLTIENNLFVKGGEIYLPDTSTKLSEGASDSFKVTTPSGLIELGPKNTGHCHIETDKTNFYFNKRINVNEGIISSYNEDLNLRREQSDDGSLTLGVGTLYSKAKNDSQVQLGGFTLNTGLEDTYHVYMPGVSPNAFAGATKRLTVAATKNGTAIANTTMLNAFLAHEETVSISTSNTDTIIIEISDFGLNYGQWYGITFGSSQWRAKDIDIEISSDNGSNYTSIYSENDQPHSTVRTYYSGGSTTINKIKYTLTNWNTSSTRINHIFGYKYLMGDTNYLDKYMNSSLYASINWKDGYPATFGDGGDLVIKHTGSDSVIETHATASAGDLYIKSQGTNHDLYLQATDDIFIRPNGTDNGIKVQAGDNVELYYDGDRKIRTTSTGVNVEGTVVATGFSGDGSALTNVTGTDSTKVAKAGDTMTGDLTIQKDDPTLTLYNDGGANTDPNGTIIFSESNNTQNFDINYNGALDRLEFRGRVGNTDNTDLVLINRDLTTTMQVLGGATMASEVDGPFTALRLMNKKTYGSGTGTNEKVRFAMGISEGSTAFSAREGFVIEAGILDESDSSNAVIDFKVRDGGTIGTYQRVNGSNKSVDFFDKITLPDNKAAEWPNGSIRAEGNTLKLVATTLIDLQDDTQVQGDLTVKGDEKQFWLKSDDRNLARIIPRGTTGDDVDKGLFSLIASDSSSGQTNIEKVRIDSAGNSWFNGGAVSFGDNVTITGNLTVDGTTTTLNTTTVEVEDNILQLNTTQGSPDTATAATSGISVYRGDGVTQASLIFDDGDDTWDITNKLKVGVNLYVGGSVFEVQGANPYIKGTGTGAMRIKHTSGQTMYLRPDETGALSIFEGANSQTVYMMTVSPSSNNTQNDSAKLAFQSRSKKSDGTNQSKTAVIKHTTHDIANNYGTLDFAGTNIAKFNMDAEIAKSTPTLKFNNLAGGGLDPILEASGSNFNIKTTSITAMTLALDTGNATFAGSVNVNTNGLINFEQNPDVDTGTEVVAQVTKATYTAAFFDFVIKKGTNVRAGVVYACHDGSTGIEYAETSTVSLGDTSDVTLSVDLGSSTMRLLATTTSNDWSVKSLIRAI